MPNEENDQSIDKNLELTLTLELANNFKYHNMHIIEDLKEARWGKLVGTKKKLEKTVAQMLEFDENFKSTEPRSSMNLKYKKYEKE